MNIQNCIITRVVVDFTSEFRTIIWLKTRSARGKWDGIFIFPDEKPQSKFWLLNMMNFAGESSSVSLMEGKNIREVTNCNNEVIGFGDPIKDKFILLDKKQTVKIFTEAELRAEYK